MPTPVPPPQINNSKSRDACQVKETGAKEKDRESRSRRQDRVVEKDEGRRERSRSRSRNDNEGSKDDSTGGRKKERRFREEKSSKRMDASASQMEKTSSSDFLLPKVVEELAAMVAVSGEELEEAARSSLSRAAELDFLDDQSSSLYARYRARVTELKQSEGQQEGKRKRKSRWGAKESQVVEVAPGSSGGPGVALPTALGTIVAPAVIQTPERSPAMKAYAAKIFGGVELTEDQWKHCEIQLQMNTLMTSKPVGMAVNSDEGGTWEHKLRRAEIERTESSRWKENYQNDDDPPISHHISHFLPPEELAKFMQRQKVMSSGGQMDTSENQDSKLGGDNRGFQLLQRMGWKEGGGLGAMGQGIAAPIAKSGQVERLGLGVDRGQLTEEEDEFSTYRKRMMLSYKFRPNPMKNPRRDYY